MIDVPPITAKELFESMVEAPPDDTCRTCRFWKPIYKRDEFALCISRDVEIVFNAKRPLIPPAAFGCRFHQPKETG